MAGSWRGGVAQLGEHLLCKQGVIGSNPFASTNAFLKREIIALGVLLDCVGFAGFGELWLVMVVTEKQRVQVCMTSHTQEVVASVGLLVLPCCYFQGDSGVVHMVF